MFGSRSSRYAREERAPRTRRTGFFHHHKNPERQAAGFKAALHNPNTTSAGRRHAKEELKYMGRGREAHVPLSVRIKRWIGIRSRPRHHASTRRY